MLTSSTARNVCCNAVYLECTGDSSITTKSIFPSVIRRFYKKTEASYFEKRTVSYDTVELFFASGILHSKTFESFRCTVGVDMSGQRLRGEVCLPIWWTIWLPSVDDTSQPNKVLAIFLNLTNVCWAEHRILSASLLAVFLAEHWILLDSLLASNMCDLGLQVSCLIFLSWHEQYAKEWFRLQ